MGKVGNKTARTVTSVRFLTLVSRRWLNSPVFRSIMLADAMIRLHSRIES
jgi:hypothetical protein